MTKGRQENARTLAALLGEGQERALERLKASVLITAAPEGAELAGYLGQLLRRTVASVHHDESGPSSPDVEVVIGGAAPKTGAKHVWVVTSGTRIIVSDSPIALAAKPTLAIVNALASCYGAAVATQRAIGFEPPVPLRLPIDFDLADFVPELAELAEEPVDLGEMYLAGGGAVGNGVVFGLSMFPVVGLLHVSDPDDVSDGSLNRCWFFEECDVDQSKAGVLVARAQPLFPNLRLVPHPVVLSKVPGADDGAWLRRLIVAVDSRRARRSLQNELPRETFDASTTGIAEIVLHFNQLPAQKACLSCTYHEAPDEKAHEAHVAHSLGVDVGDVVSHFVSEDAAAKIVRKYPDLRAEQLVGLAYDSLFKQLCGAGALKTEADRQVLAPFAFVSVLAGLWLAIEIVRRVGRDDVSEPFNYWRVSPWAAPSQRMRQVRPRKPDCEFCGNPVLVGVTEDLWGTEPRLPSQSADQPSTSVDGTGDNLLIQPG